MKKQSKTTTVIRIDQEKGNYTTISRSVLMNTDLTDPAKTLLQIILNNKEGWRLVLSYYRKLLLWSNDKMAYAVANLIDNGFMKKEKHSKGKDKGFCYTYVISEYGNLNPNRERADENEIMDSINDEETQMCDESVQQEPIQEAIPTAVEPVQSEEDNQINAKAEVKLEPDKPLAVEKPKVFTPDPNFELTVQTLLADVLASWDEPDFIKKVAVHYMGKVYSGEITPENFNKEKMVTQIRKRILELCKAVMEDSITRGTEFQRGVVHKKALAYCEGKINNGEPLDERTLRTKVLMYTSDATRPTYNNVDPRYLD